MKSRTFTSSLSALAALLILLTGCSPVKILGTRSAEDFSLSEYASYRFYEIAIDTVDTPEFFERMKWIEEDLRAGFAETGVSFTRDQPELLVNIGLVFEEKTQMRETNFTADAPKYMGNMNYSWEREMVEMGTYNEGTLVMHLVDADSKVLLWEGILQSVLVRDDAQARKNIKRAVNLLFQELK